MCLRPWAQARCLGAYRGLGLGALPPPDFPGQDEDGRIQKGSHMGIAMTATPIYAGILGLLLVLLSADVIRHRLRARVSVGDGADKALAKAIRVQANFAEYAPMGLILLALAEAQGAPLWVVHLLGLMLVAGRFAHAIGYGRTPQIVALRQAGMVLTFTMLTVTALACLVHALF